MAKFGYGGFDAKLPNANDEPWTRLATISEHLEDGTPIPSDLALWLDNAIRFSNQDADEFLERLGLKRRRGRPNHKHSANAWMIWGGDVCEREHHGETPEAALSSMIVAYMEATGNDVTRSQAQAWRDQFREHTAGTGISVAPVKRGL